MGVTAQSGITYSLCEWSAIRCATPTDLFVQSHVDGKEKPLGIEKEASLGS